MTQQNIWKKIGTYTLRGLFYLLSLCVGFDCFIWGYHYLQPIFGQSNLWLILIAALAGLVLNWLLFGKDALPTMNAIINEIKDLVQKGKTPYKRTPGYIMAATVLPVIVSVGSGALMGLFSYKCYHHAAIQLGHTSIQFSPVFAIIMSTAIGILTMTLLQDAMKDDFAAFFLSFNKVKKESVRQAIEKIMAEKSDDRLSQIKNIKEIQSLLGEAVKRNVFFTLLSNIAKDQEEYQSWMQQCDVEKSYQPHFFLSIKATLNHPVKIAIFAITLPIAFIGLGAGIKEWLTATYQLLSSSLAGPWPMLICVALGILATFAEIIFTSQACAKMVQQLSSIFSKKASKKKNKNKAGVLLVALLLFGILASILNAAVNGAIGMGLSISPTSLVLGIAAAVLSLMVMLGNLIPLLQDWAKPGAFPTSQFIQSIGSIFFVGAIIASQLYTGGILSFEIMLATTISASVLGAIMTFVPMALPKAHDPKTPHQTSDALNPAQKKQPQTGTSSSETASSRSTPTFDHA